MKSSKEIIKTSILILIVVGTIIISFIFYKKETEEFIYYDENTITVLNENTTQNEAFVESKENTASSIKVYVTGEVNNPGVKELEEGARIEDAINSAGGLTVYADISKVNLAYMLEDGQKLYIPNKDDQIEEYITTENDDGVVESQGEKNNVKVNINKADVQELTELPGVGESLASRIVSYRNENGKFKSIEDLKNVSGIGEKKYESIKEYVVVK